MKFPNVIISSRGAFIRGAYNRTYLFLQVDGPITRGDVNMISHSAMIDWMQPQRVSRKKNIQRLWIAFTANRKREIRVEKFLNMRNEQIKTIVVDRIGVNLATLHRFLRSYWMNSKRKVNGRYGHQPRFQGFSLTNSRLSCFHFQRTCRLLFNITTRKSVDSGQFYP